MSIYDPKEGMEPCPFCGIPGEVYKRGGPGWGIMHNEKDCPIYSFRDFYTPVYDTRDLAVSAWNTRHQLAVPECVITPECKHGRNPRTCLECGQELLMGETHKRVC